MSDAIEYASVGACVRAPRVLVSYSAGSAWLANARRAIRTLSRTWGGAGCALLPLAENENLADTLHAIMGAYDPDHVAWHPVLYSDLAEDDPGFRERFLAQNQLTGVSAEQVWDVAKIDPALSFSGDLVASQVDAWCSPFADVDAQSRAFTSTDIAFLHRDGSSGAHLTVMSSDSIGQVWSPDLSMMDPMIALMLETRLGSIVAAEHNQFAIPFPELEQDVPALIELAITGKLGYDWSLDRLKAGATLSTITKLEERGILGLTPFGRSQVGLVKVHAGYDAPTVCVVGDTPEDHALAMMCDRTFNHAAWIPLRLLRDSGPAGQAARTAGRALHRQTRHQEPVLLISASEAADVLVEAMEQFGIPTGGRELMRISSPAEVVERDGRCLLADDESYDVPLSVPIRRDSDGIALLTPVAAPPPTATRKLGSDVAWCVDVSVASDRPPAKTAISSSAVAPVAPGRFSAVRVRVSWHGLSYSSVNIGFVSAGASSHARTAKPLLRFPSAEVVFAELAAKNEASVQRSAPGHRAANCVELWGSLASAMEDLGGQNRHLLDAFIPAKISLTGAYSAGYAIHGRGFLTLQHAVDALGSTEAETRDTVDRLLASRVLARGLVLNCKRCAAQDFYSLGHLTDAGFECKICGRINSLSYGRWYKKCAEPQWYYSLDQVVTNLLTQNGDVPLLATAELGRGKRSVQWAPELLVSWRGSEAEIDIAVIIDGKVVVGEAKSTSKLATAKKSTDKAVARLVKTAKLLQADHIVLATTENRWSEGILNAVEEAVTRTWTSGPLPTVSELTNLRPTKPSIATGDAPEA